jgi:hypothetical protein
MSAASNLVVLPVPGAAIPSAPGAPPAGAGTIPRSPAALELTGAIDEPGVLSLYSDADHLEALSNTLDMVPPEQEDEIVALIGQTLAAYTDKRDRFARFLAHLDNQIAFGKQEIERLERRVSMFTRFVERIETWTERALFKLGKTAKGKWPKLEGGTSTLGLKNLPETVAWDDESQVPLAFCKATITLPAPLWEEILDALPVELAGRVTDGAKRKLEPQKTPVKKAIEAGEIVPGAHIDSDRVKLVRA